MTLDAAIEIITLSKSYEFEGDTDLLEEAIQLAIEAMKRIKEYHHMDNTYQNLPGESRY